MQKFLAKILPIIGMAVFIILLIIGLIVFSYIILIAALIGLVLFGIGYIKARLVGQKQPPTTNEQEKHSGRVIDHNEIK